MEPMLLRANVPCVRCWRCRRVNTLMDRGFWNCESDVVVLPYDIEVSAL